MAKLKLSAIVSEMRGKLNGSVFSKNRSGAYIRTKVTPVNPSTTFQVAVRALLSTYSQQWRTLTEAQRKAWNAAVSNWAKTDIFGDIKNPTGLNLFIKLNINIANVGGVAIVDPPLPASTGIWEDLTLNMDASATTMNLGFVENTDMSGQEIVIEATPPMSPGKDFVKTEFRQIMTYTGGGSSPVTGLAAAYIAKFGAFPAGQKVTVRVKAIEPTTGTPGQYTSVSTIVVP